MRVKQVTSDSFKRRISCNQVGQEQQLQRLLGRQTAGTYNEPLPSHSTVTNHRVHSIRHSYGRRILSDTCRRAHHASPKHCTARFIHTLRPLSRSTPPTRRDPGGLTCDSRVEGCSTRQRSIFFRRHGFTRTIYSTVATSRARPRRFYDSSSEGAYSHSKRRQNT